MFVKTTTLLSILAGLLVAHYTSANKRLCTSSTLDLYHARGAESEQHPEMEISAAE